MCLKCSLRHLLPHFFLRGSLWMKSVLLVGCVTSAGTLWEPKGSVGDGSWGNGLGAGTLRWPGWTMGGTGMWNLEVWNKNVTLAKTTCTNQYLYYLCSMVLLWCCLSKMLPIGNTQNVPLSSLYPPGTGTPTGFEGLEREKVGQGLIFALCLDGGPRFLSWAECIVHPK